MGRFQYSGLHHVAFATADMNKTIAYWRDLLGFKIVLGLGNKEESQYAFQVSKEMLVFFFEWKEVEPVKNKRHGEPVTGPFIFDHLAIHLNNLDEVVKLQNQLVCAEMPVSDIIDHGFLNSIYTFDPNGIPLEFTTMVPGVDLDQNPVFVDSFPVKKIAEGLKPVVGKWPVCDEDPEFDRYIVPGKEKDYFK